MAKLDTPWSDRRRSILQGMGHAPIVLCVSERDKDAITQLLLDDGVIEPAGMERHRITPAGRILYAMHRLHESDEGGPWSLNDIRRFTSVKSLPLGECHSALHTLELRGIVVAEPSTRTPKWDLVRSGLRL